MAPGMMEAVGIAGFIFGAIALSIAIYHRGISAGRSVATIEEIAKIQQVSSAAMQSQALALANYAQGMQSLGQGLQDVASSTRDFISVQRTANEALALGLRTLGSRVRLLEEEKQVRS
jgi:hypothetical protein